MNVPIFDYDKMYNEWWHLAQEGRSNVSWPGKIKYFALSSGTSGAASKHIPISKDMVKSIRKTSIRQILSLSKYDLPDKFFSKGILAVGGSTDLRRNGHYFEGDLSGITAAQIPFWFQQKCLFRVPQSRHVLRDHARHVDLVRPLQHELSGRVPCVHPLPRRRCRHKQEF